MSTNERGRPRRSDHNTSPEVIAVRVQHPGDTLVWTCESCHAPIDGDGYLTVDRRDVHLYERFTGDVRGDVLPLSALLAGPRPAHWHALHVACGDDGNLYSIDLGRIRTLAQVIEWTAHLMGKRWLQYTDWATLLRTIAGVNA